MYVNGICLLLTSTRPQDVGLCSRAAIVSWCTMIYLRPPNCHGEQRREWIGGMLWQQTESHRYIPIHGATIVLWHDKKWNGRPDSKAWLCFCFEQFTLRLKLRCRNGLDKTFSISTEMPLVIILFPRANTDQMTPNTFIKKESRFAKLNLQNTILIP